MALGRNSTLHEIAKTAVLNRQTQYWHRDGVVEAMVSAAEAVQHYGECAIIDAMEREIKRYEYVCNFDDPCDPIDIYKSDLITGQYFWALGEFVNRA